MKIPFFGKRKPSPRNELANELMRTKEELDEANLRIALSKLNNRQQAKLIKILELRKELRSGQSKKH